MPRNKDLGQRVSSTIEARWAENARVTQLLKDKLSQSLDNVSMVGNKLKTIKVTIPAKHYYYSVSHILPHKTDETDEYVLFDDKEEIMSCTDDSYVDKFSSYILNTINEELEMNSIYEQMNKIDDKESLNEKYNVRTLRDVKNLQEAEAPKSDRSSIKTRVNELIDMVDWSKWEKFTSTGDDTKPEVKKTKATDDGIRVDVYLGWDYGHNDDIEEYVKAVNEKFEAFAAIVRKQEPSWSVKLVKSHGSRGVTWTNYWAQVTVKNSITEATKVERPKGFKGSVGGYLAIDRYGIWVSSKPNSGGVKISDANYDWIKENFKLTTLPEEEYKTIWGRGTVYKIEKKDAIKESVETDNNMKKLQDAAASVKCKLTPGFIEYAIEDPELLDDAIEDELLYCGKVLCDEFPEMTSWEFGEDDELTDQYGSYCVVETGTDEGRILVQVDGHGRIYNLE